MLRRAPIADIAMERGMRPVAGTRHMAVFDRIEVDVIDVVLQFAFVAGQVLPATATSSHRTRRLHVWAFHRRPAQPQTAQHTQRGRKARHGATCGPG